MNRWSVFFIVGLVVIVGSLVLAAAFLPSDRNYGTDKAKSDLRAFSMALDTYRERVGSYPESGVGLKGLVERDFIARVPTDPWLRPYYYRKPGQHNPQSYDLWTYGADGREGGTGLDRDVTNWTD